MQFRRIGFLTAISILCIFSCTAASADVLTDPEAQAIYKCYQMLDTFDFTRSLQMSEALVKRYPGNFNSYHLRGRALMGKGQNTKALIDIKRAMQINPAFKNGENYRGEICKGLNDLRGAVNAFEYAYTLDPCDDKLILTLRPLYQQLGMDPKHYRVALKNNTLWRAVGLEKKGKSAEALALYNAYLKQFPKAEIAYQYRANLFFYAKDYKRACADYVKSIELYPADASTYASAASCYDCMGDNENACRFFDRCLQTTKNSVGYQYRYGNLLRKMKRFDRAITLYTNLLKLEPDSSDAYRFRGDSYLALNKCKEALADYTSAIDTSAYPSPDTYRQRAKVYDLMHQPDKAKRDRERATESM
jgi:tetratricopeptide (TPR) repeat protein